MHLVIFVLSIFNSIVRAFALAYLWHLFAVPLGAPEVGPLHAWGLAVLLGLFSVDTENIRATLSRDEKDESTVKMNFMVQFGLLITVPIMVLVAHIVVTFFGPVTT